MNRRLLVLICTFVVVSASAIVSANPHWFVSNASKGTVIAFSNICQPGAHPVWPALPLDRIPGGKVIVVIPESGAQQWADALKDQLCIDVAR